MLLPDAPTRMTTNDLSVGIGHEGSAPPSFVPIDSKKEIATDLYQQEQMEATVRQLQKGLPTQPPLKIQLRPQVAMSDHGG